MTKTPLFNDMEDGNVPFIVANFLKLLMYDSNGTSFTEHSMGYQLKLKFSQKKKKKKFDMINQNKTVYFTN